MHGFPESWYSWRHQITALAEAGYHVVAPDMRGYGKTERPVGADRYNVLEIAGDLVGLVAALGEERAVIVGHDWGSWMAARAALLRPDVFTGVVLLSVPYTPWTDSPVPPMERIAATTPEGMVFYQLYFQDPEVAAELEEDVRRSMLALLYSASGSAPPAERWRPTFRRADGFFSSVQVPPELPGWLEEEDLQVYVRQFEHSGFAAPLSWYRNIDRNWRLRGWERGAPLTQPTLFIGGELDPGIEVSREPYEQLETHVPHLTRKVLLPGRGHWIQQEAPGEVNRLLLEFLSAHAPWRGEQSAVPVHREKRHALVFDSARFRLLDVRIEPGDTTAFHVHSEAALFVAIGTSPIDVQPAGGSWSETAPTADPAFAVGEVIVDSAYASTPVTHRVTNVGDRLFHLLMLASAGPVDEPGAAWAGEEALGAPEIVSSWFDQYRLHLAPGSATDWHAPPNPLLIVSPRDGALEVRLDSGEAAVLARAGSWFLVPADARFRLSNPHPSPGVAVAVRIR